MRLSTIVIFLGLACGGGLSPVGPSTERRRGGSRGGETSRGGAVAPDTAAVYAATFTASSRCAPALEPEARERAYTETLRSDGTIDWSSPTLNPPSGHATISSGVLADNALSCSIDVERDPQSDDFHGLWEDFGSGKVLNISGKGSGVVRGSEVAGAFDGLFALYDPLDPPQPGILFTAHYCTARDHQFRFVKQ
jgi:hypothetical protein